MKIKKVVNFFLDDIAFFFPYIFIFYLANSLLSFFINTWQSFFYWPAFHFGIVCLALLSLLSPKYSKIFSKTKGSKLIKNIKARKFNPSTKIFKNNKALFKTASFKPTAFIFNFLFFLAKHIVIFVVIFITFLSSFMIRLAKNFWFGLGKKFKEINRKNLLRFFLVLIAALLIRLLLGSEPNILDLFILIFGIFSVLFLPTGRLSLGIALLLLFFCSILLLFNREVSLGLTAVYAFYFLVIAVFTEVRGLVFSS